MYYSGRHKKFPFRIRATTAKRSVKRYDPITVQILIMVVLLLLNRAVYTGK